MGGGEQPEREPVARKLNGSDPKTTAVLEVHTAASEYRQTQCFARGRCRYYMDSTWLEPGCSMYSGCWTGVMSWDTCQKYCAAYPHVRYFSHSTRGMRQCWCIRKIPNWRSDSWRNEQCDPSTSSNYDTAGKVCPTPHPTPYPTP